MTRGTAPAALLAVALACAVCAGSADAAERVRCPVCGQVFDDTVLTCPNDGTDLEREGKRVEPRGAPSPEAGSGDEAADGATDEPSFAKYKRNDVGGDRRRADDAEIGYDDRRSRLGEDRRGEAAAERKRLLEEKRAQAFAAEDGRLRGEYEARRLKMWERRRERAEEDRRAAEGFDDLKRRSLWGRGAPLVSAGLRISWMREGDDPGPVASAEIDVNFAKTALRAGLSSAIGVRSLSHRDDLVFMESVSVGAQLPWRFSPYVVGRAGIGALATNRFGQDMTYVVRSLGAEVGLDCRIARWLVVTPSLGYAVLAVDSAYWNSFTARLSVGF
jgi:hypothetical protein